MTPLLVALTVFASVAVAAALTLWMIGSLYDVVRNSGRESRARADRLEANLRAVEDLMRWRAEQAGKREVRLGTLARANDAVRELAEATRNRLDVVESTADRAKCEVDDLRERIDASDSSTALAFGRVAASAGEALALAKSHEAAVRRWESDRANGARAKQRRQS